MLETNKIHQGDCLELMKQLPDNSVDCIITDPPYGINKEGILNDHNLWAYEIDYFRLLKDNCWLGIYCSIGYINNIIKLLEKQGLNYVWAHITYINNGMVRGRLGFNNYMLCLIFSKGEVKIRKQIRDIYEISCPGAKENGHPTPKEKGAIRDLILLMTKEQDLILDPFIGSGTTAVACKQLNRNFIGMELSQEYIDIANKRLKECEEPLTRFVK